LPSLGKSSHGYDDHLKKAKHDEAASEMLCDNGNFPDWSIISSFYFALHCIDTYAHKLGVKTFAPVLDERTSAHSKRKRFVRKNLGRLFVSYGKLYSRSEQCRYDPKYFQLIPQDLPKKMLDEARKFLTIC